MKRIGLGILLCISLGICAAEDTETEIDTQEETKRPEDITPAPETQEVELQEQVPETEEQLQETVKIETDKVLPQEPEPVQKQEQQTGTEEIHELLPEPSEITEVTQTEEPLPQETFVEENGAIDTVEKPSLVTEEYTPVIDTIFPSAEEMVLDQAPFVPQEIMADDFEETELEEAQIAGVDTVSLEEGQGNWLFKRMWWERAQETYQKLKTHIDKIMEHRADFFGRRSSLDKELFDTFYLTLGMGISEFTTMLQELKNWVTSERPEGETLSAEKQHILDTLKMEQETIESMVAHVDMLKQLDNAIENSLGIIIEVINAARRFEREGWECFKEIGVVLSEKKARELFYKLDVSLQNVKQLSTYLEKSFATYFSKLEDRARQTVSFLQTQLTALKEKQIDLKAQVDELNRKIDIQDQEKIEDLEEEIAKKPKTWWGSITESIRSFFRIIRSLLPW